MNVLEQLGLDITHISKEVKELAAKAAIYTEKIENSLKSNIALDIASVVPEGEKDREIIISILEIAYKTCVSIQNTDVSGVSARLQRAGSDITQLLHNNSKHTVSFYVTCFEVVFNDLFGKKLS